jgi:hypothetical protein
MRHSRTAAGLCRQMEEVPSQQFFLRINTRIFANRLDYHELEGNTNNKKPITGSGVQPCSRSLSIQSRSSSHTTTPLRESERILEAAGGKQGTSRKLQPGEGMCAYGAAAPSRDDGRLPPRRPGLTPPAASGTTSFRRSSGSARFRTSPELAPRLQFASSLGLNLSAAADCSSWTTTMTTTPPCFYIYI